MPTEVISANAGEVVFEVTGSNAGDPVQTFTYTGTGLTVEDGVLTAGTLDTSLWQIEAVGPGGASSVIDMVSASGWALDLTDLGSNATVGLNLFHFFIVADVVDRVGDADLTELYPVIYSLSGDTSLSGTAGPDAILGGADLIQLGGLGGDDFLSSQAVEATISGGTGNDTIDALGEGATALGGAGDDSLTGGEGGQTLNGQAGDDLLIGGRFNDPEDGGDMLIGGLGNDQLFGYHGNDTLIGGPGDDRILVRNDADRVSAGDGRDVMTFFTGTHSASGGAGGDAYVVYVNVGYGPGTGFAVDRLVIRDFDIAEDVLVMGSNDKTFLTAEMAYATFMNEAEQVGSDAVFDNGETRIVLRDVDLLELSADNFVRFEEGISEGWTEWGTVTVAGAAGDDTLRGTSGDDTVLAGLGDDDARAGGGDDRVIGMGGDDVLRGGHGDDLLSGGAGRDVLMAERGADTLFGGAGADVFVLFVDDDRVSPDPHWETDVTETAVIADFDLSEDVLMLRESDNGFETGRDRYADFMEHATQEGAHVVYDDGRSQVTILNTDLDDLTAAHFLGDDLGFYDWATLV